MSGRLGSPALVHRGMPPIHFQKTFLHGVPFRDRCRLLTRQSCIHLSRTNLDFPLLRAALKHRACHYRTGFSSRRGRQNRALQNGLAQLLGAHEGRQNFSHVARRSRQNRANPHTSKNEDIPRDPYNTKPFTEAQIQQVLQSIPDDAAKGQAVFVAAGKLYRLDNSKLSSEENPAAKPYSWALAHDVRPASQALGARGCVECHAADSQVYFANVVARGPVESTNALSKGIWEMRGDDKNVGSFFAFTFTFRPMLKCIVFGAAFIVLAMCSSTTVCAASERLPPLVEKENSAMSFNAKTVLRRDGSGGSFSRADGHRNSNT